MAKMSNQGGDPALKDKSEQFFDFEFLTEMGSWGSDYSIPVGLVKFLERKVVENGARKKVARTGLSRGNARDVMCAHFFRAVFFAFTAHTFFS